MEMIEIENKEDHRQKNIMSKERSDNNVDVLAKCACVLAETTHKGRRHPHQQEVLELKLRRQAGARLRVYLCINFIISEREL